MVSLTHGMGMLLHAILGMIMIIKLIKEPYCLKVQHLCILSLVLPPIMPLEHLLFILF
jgi:hypothetical protein